MYEILKHAHSGLRWVVLFALLFAIFNAFSGKSSKPVNLLALISTHIQLILGLVLYFISPLVQFGSGVMKNSVLRFYTVEHISLMLVAIALITIGYSKAKRADSQANAAKKIRLFYLIGLILILISIPWPFRGLGGGWF